MAGRNEMFTKRRVSISWATALTIWFLNFFLPNPGFTQESNKSARSPVSGFLRDLTIDSQLQGVKVQLRGDGLAKDFQNFTLAHPPRLVIDFPGVLTSFPKKSLHVGHPLLKEIRFGHHPDKLRLVLTFPATKVPSHQIVQEEGSLSIIVGTIEKLPEKGKKPEAKEEREMGGTGPPERKLPPAPSPSPAAVPPAKAGEEKTSTPPPEKRAGKIYSGEKISLDFIDADIRSVLALISETAKRQIVPEAEVQGTITLRLTDVPWDQALDVILSIYNLKSLDEGNLIRILPREKSS